MRSLDLYPYLVVDFSTHKNLWSLFSKPTAVSFNCFSEKDPKLLKHRNTNTRALLHLDWCLMFWVLVFRACSLWSLDLSPSPFSESQVFFFGTIASPFNCILTSLFSFYTDRLVKGAVMLPNNIKTQKFWENKNFDRESKNPKQKQIKSKPT